MYFKCLNAKELFEQLNIEILQELEVFVTKQYVYDLFIKKKQKKVPDYLAILIDDRKYIGVFTIYFQSNNLHIDNLYFPNLCSSRFCTIVRQMWKFLLKYFYRPYVLRHRFSSLNINFYLDSSFVDFSHDDMKKVVWNNYNLWIDILELSDDRFIYRSEINTELIPCFIDYYNSKYSKGFFENEIVNSENKTPNVDNLVEKVKAVKIVDTIDDIVHQFELDISLLSDDCVNGNAIIQAKSLGLILAKSKLESSICDSTGIGCFAGKHFKQNDEICRFQGKIITEDERAKNAQNVDGFWCIDLAGGKYMIPSKSCCANYINSPFKCFNDGKASKPNSKLVVDKRRKMARVVALFNIKLGTEILMPYGRSFKM
jgi:hypothetical protein